MPPISEKFILDHPGRTFEKVLLVPRRSNISSRYSDEIDLSSTVALNPDRTQSPLRIKIPVVTANMDTVTENAMARTVSLHGAMGIIHRFMPISQQVAEIKAVKGTMRIMETDPPVVTATTRIRTIRNMLAEEKRGYVIVHNGKKGDLFDGTFSGIATPRDFDAGGDFTYVSKVMTHRDDVLTVEDGTTFEDAVVFMRQHRLEKVPVVDESGRLIGVYSMHDYNFRQKYKNAALDDQGRLVVGGAIGVKPKDVDRALALVEAGADTLVVDIAHGGLDYIEQMLYRLKIIEGIKIPIIVGNGAGDEVVAYIRDSGADAIKIGIGAGKVCTTRDIAGAGFPQLEAILMARALLERDTHPLPIIADGGIRKPADVDKAIAAGANTVMIGTLFAGTDMSPGRVVTPDGVQKKMVQGMASANAFDKRRALGDSTTDMEQFVPEGREIFVNYQGDGSTVRVLYELAGGLRSSFSYIGAHTVEEAWERGRFIEIDEVEQRR